MTSHSGGSHWGPTPQHPVLSCLASVTAALDEVAGVDPSWMRTVDKQEALLAADRIIERTRGLQLSLLACAEDVAAETGARNPSAWLASQTRRDYPVVASTGRLADAVARWVQVATGVSEGRVNCDQARVITGCLDDLPADLLGPELLAKAEAWLVDQAAHFTPKELRRLGRGILEVIAPDEFDEAERRRLEDEEARAQNKTRLGIRRNGDGTSRVTATLPDHVVDRLLVYLDAIASPRRSRDVDGEGGASTESGRSPGQVGVTDPATGKRLPADQVRGLALQTLLEHLDPHKLPQHGGVPTTIMITLTLDQLFANLGSADLLTGGQITASQARRLACNADLIPVVLGGKSEILDLGRKRRLFSPAQHRAMALRDRECRAEGCSIPAAWCEAHHWKEPWSHGGKTDLADGKLLCSWHHHRCHDDRYDTTHLPTGAVRFHRRR